MRDELATVLKYYLLLHTLFDISSPAPISTVAGGGLGGPPGVRGAGGHPAAAALDAAGGGEAGTRARRSTISKKIPKERLSRCTNQTRRQKRQDSLKCNEATTYIAKQVKVINHVTVETVIVKDRAVCTSSYVSVTMPYLWLIGTGMLDEEGVRDLKQLAIVGQR